MWEEGEDPIKPQRGTVLSCLVVLLLASLAAYGVYWLI
jgi:hypothetical protein